MFIAGTEIASTCIFLTWAMELFDVTLVGVNAENGRKLFLTLVVLTVLWAGGRLFVSLAAALLLRRASPPGKRAERAFFWTRQGVRLAVALLIGFAIVSIWFDDPVRLSTALGLVTAGLAFALQKLITAIAGYFVILRGETFNVGDRITMGGVRGDVIGLSFTQTTIMEMGQPPAVQNADPAMWVRSRQYTGRLVTVSNARIFDEPVYNYTRELPVIWEEMSVPIPYRADAAVAERILLAAAERHAADLASLGEEALREMERRYFVQRVDMKPAVYWRLTDNWLELTVRFVAPTHAVRELKHRMTREILAGLGRAGIEVASATLEVISSPTGAAVRRERRAGAS